MKYVEDENLTFKRGGHIEVNVNRHFYITNTSLQVTLFHENTAI